MEEHWGRVNMESMLERKPLHPVEQQAAPARICVTGEDTTMASALLPARESKEHVCCIVALTVPCPASTPGAAGFIGSRVVMRLLACGHSVHATRRAAGDDDAMAAALDALPGAAERLRWFEADLLQEGSFDAAVAGCK